MVGAVQNNSISVTYGSLRVGTHHRDRRQRKVDETDDHAISLFVASDDDGIDQSTRQEALPLSTTHDRLGYALEQCHFFNCNVTIST